MIRSITLSLFFITFTAIAVFFGQSAEADTRSVYTITDIEIDERAATVIEARQKAMASARVQGARQLIRKITLEEDRISAGGVPVDLTLAERLAAAVDVQEETAGAGRYRGTLSVVLNPVSVRRHLNSLSVPYVDTQGPLSLLVPIAPRELEYAWKEALGEGNRSGLSPYTTAAGTDYSTNMLWDELAIEASATGARRGIFAELIGRDGAYRVKLSTLTAAGRETIGTTRSVATLSGASAAVSDYLGEVWKRRAIVRDTTRTLQNATVLYTSLAEWNTLRGALARSPQVSDFKIGAIARDGAVVTFAFAGERARLQRDLLQRGVSFTEEGQYWVLRSAVSAPVLNE